MLRCCILVLCSLSLVSCVGMRGGWHADNWPQELPALAYFQCSYQSDPVNQRHQTESEYLEWIISFYQGSLLYPAGWQDVQSGILALVLPREQRQQQLRLQELGAVIASDWAKHNAVRLIDNRLLSLWGYMLQLAPDNQQLTRYIDTIDADIQHILAGELDPVVINPRRYEDRLNIPFFDDF